MVAKKSAKARISGKYYFGYGQRKEGEYWFNFPYDEDAKGIVTEAEELVKHVGDAFPVALSGCPENAFWGAVKAMMSKSCGRRCINMDTA